MGLCYFDGRFRYGVLVYFLFVSSVHVQSTKPYFNDTASDLEHVGNDNGIFSSTWSRHKRSTGIKSGLVDIARFIDKSPPVKNHVVYVDDTMKRLLFEVTVENALPVFTVQTPAGKNYRAHPSINGSPGNGTVISTLDIPISSSDYGFWKFTKLDVTTWSVSIKGESPLYIRHKFYEKGSTSPIVAAPILGNDYTLEVDVVGFQNVKTVDNYLLFTTSKLSPLAMNPLVHRGGNTFENGSFKMPDKPFIVGIQGQDKSGHFFRRIDPTEIIPVSLSLDISLHTDATMFEYSLFNITFVVSNLLSTKQDVDILVSDTKGFAKDPKFLSSTLKVGENFTGMFVIESTSAGSTTMVKIWTRQFLGNSTFREGPVERRKITVVKNTTTSTSMPTSVSTTSINVTGVTFSTDNSTTIFSQTAAASNTTTTAGYVAQVTVTNGHSNTTTIAKAVTRGKPVVIPSRQINSTSTLMPQSLNRGSSRYGSIPVTLMSGSVTVSTDTQTAHFKKPDNPDEVGDSGRKSESDSSSMKVELSAGVIVASMFTGTVVGVAAIATLAIIFKKAMTIKNKRVVPEDETEVIERSTTPERRKRSVVFY